MWYFSFYGRCFSTWAEETILHHLLQKSSLRAGASNTGSSKEGEKRIPVTNGKGVLLMPTKMPQYQASDPQTPHVTVPEKRLPPSRHGMVMLEILPSILTSHGSGMAGMNLS